MKSKIILLTMLSISSLLGCKSSTNEDKKIDHFYTEKGEWDSARIPLIKPYEAVITDTKYGWSINLDGFDGDTGFYNVKKVNVVDSLILTYSINTLLHGQLVNQVWHVIIPQKHIEKGFASHEQYLNYLMTLGLKAEPKLLNIETIAEYYEGHQIIDWKKINASNR